MTQHECVHSTRCDGGETFDAREAAYAWGCAACRETVVAFNKLESLAGFAAGVFDLLRLRLARFNDAGHGSGGSKNFVGMPTPAAAGMIAALFTASRSPLHDWRWSVAWFPAGGWAWRPHDEHDPVLQLQGYSWTGSNRRFRLSCSA